MLAIPAKRYDRRLVTFLNEPELDALLAAPTPSSPTGRRDRALLALAAQTGLRVSELIGLPAPMSILALAPMSVAWERDASSGSRR